MDIKIEKYFDIGCDRCCKHRSTDYEKGMESSAKILRREAKSEGWKFSKLTRETLCPECARLEFKK